MSTNSIPGFTTATVGKKVLMAVSGIIFIAFVIVHLIGNLQLFIGQEQLNKYAETLQNLGALKWGFRIFLLIFFGLHIWKGIVLWLENKKARPVSYIKEESIQATVSSRTMIYTGAMIFFFVIYHLLHFTIHSTNPEYLQLPLVDGRFDVYSMVIIGFSNPIISLVYIIAMFLLAFHLSHAISSTFQTLGLNSQKAMPRLVIASNLISFIVFLGYVSMPLSVLFGFIKLPGGGY